MVAVAFLAAACGSAADADTTDIPDLPEITVADFEAHLSTIDKPTLVNVWASWCGPCRSEAPLLDEAHTEFGDQITFIGVDIQDTQTGAKQFLAEFGLGFDHFFDRNRSIPNHYGAFGVPVTMFFAPQGELITLHNGVIDERTLALNIDELTRLSR